VTYRQASDRSAIIHSSRNTRNAAIGGGETGKFLLHELSATSIVSALIWHRFIIDIQRNVATE